MPVLGTSDLPISWAATPGQRFLTWARDHRPSELPGFSSAQVSWSCMQPNPLHLPKSLSNPDPGRVLQPRSSRRLPWETAEPRMPSTPPPNRASPERPASPSSSSLTVSAGEPATMPSPTLQPCPPPPAPLLAQPSATREEDEAGRKGRFSASSAAASSPGWGHRPCSGFEEVVSSITRVTPDLDLSDFSRPPSSQFSRNSDFSCRRSSVLSGMSGAGSSSLCLSTPASPRPSPGSPPGLPLDPLRTLSGSSPIPAPGNHSDRGRLSPSRPERGGLPTDPRVRPARPEVTPPSILSGQMSRCWPVLPPISPHRGASNTGGSPSPPVSCSESDVFEELEAIAQRTGSCWSQECSNASHSDCSSPETVLSQQADSPVLGYDLGSLGSLSRVRLLLLDQPDVEDVEAFSPVPECGMPSTNSMGRQNRDAGGPYRMFEGDWSTGSLAPLAPASSGLAVGQRRCGSVGDEELNIHTTASSEDRSNQLSLSFPEFLSDSALAVESGSVYCQSIGSSRAPEAPELEEPHPEPGGPGGVNRRRGSWKLEHQLQEKRRMDKERKAKVLHIYSQLKERGTTQSQADSPYTHSRFEDFDFLAKYCIFNQEKLSLYKQAFEAVDSDGDGYLTCYEVLLALKEIVPPEVLSDSEEIYIYRILEMVDFRVTEGLTDLRLFAVVASLAEKIASLDDFTRSLIGKLDFRTVEMKLHRAKQLFQFLLETQAGIPQAQRGRLSVEQLLMELRAGGIWPEHEEALTRQLRPLKSLDLLDFLAHLPLFLLIHGSVIANPLNDTGSL